MKPLLISSSIDPYIGHKKVAFFSITIAAVMPEFRVCGSFFMRARKLNRNVRISFALKKIAIRSLNELVSQIGKHQITGWITKRITGQISGQMWITKEDKENDGNEKKMRLFKRKKMRMIKRCEL